MKESWPNGLCCISRVPEMLLPARLLGRTSAVAIGFRNRHRSWCTVLRNDAVIREQDGEPNTVWGMQQGLPRFSLQSAQPHSSLLRSFGELMYPGPIPYRANIRRLRPVASVPVAARLKDNYGDAGRRGGRSSISSNAARGLISADIKRIALRSGETIYASVVWGRQRGAGIYAV